MGRRDGMWREKWKPRMSAHAIEWLFQFTRIQTFVYISRFYHLQANNSLFNVKCHSSCWLFLSHHSSDAWMPFQWVSIHSTIELTIAAHAKRWAHNYIPIFRRFAISYCALAIHLEFYIKYKSYLHFLHVFQINMKFLRTCSTPKSHQDASIAMLCLFRLHWKFSVEQLCQPMKQWWSI